MQARIPPGKQLERKPMHEPDEWLDDLATEFACGGDRASLDDMERAANTIRAFCALRHAADAYMAAVVCYHGNPWDRVNVRKYAEAKERLSDLINAPPNTRINPSPEGASG
jgi:hypothetical protein